MRYLVLGSVEALADAEPVDLRRPRLRLLLALLLANANQPVAAEKLRRSLWSSDEPSRPEPALREHVDALRVLLNLGDGRLSDVPGGYLLWVAPGELDVDDFTTLVQQARSLSAHDPRAATDAYEAALRLWRGPAYDGRAGVDTLESSRRALDDLRATALEELFEVLGSLGDTTTLVGRIQVATAEYPHREKLTRLLMLALCRSGRRADALRAYSALRRQLADELGTEPSPALRELEQSILARDHFFERAAQADARAVAPARIELADIEARRADPARSGISGVDVAIRSHTSLIGRLSELQQIEEQLDAVTLGRFRLVLVRGEAGIGKTRLLSELVDRNRNQFTSIVVPCSEHVTAPYITLARLFEQARSAADRNVARSFDALLDRLTMPAGTAANSMAGDAVNVARAQLMLEGVRALGALATVPTMIVIEDIQWADEATREFLEILCAELTGRSGTSLLLVLTERTFETDGRARRLTDRYQRVPCTILNLRALGEVEIGELVRELGVSTPDRSLVETLSSVSSGNPLYVREALARISALDGFVKRDAKIATMIPDTALRPPAGLADLVDERLGATDADLRDLLQIAAVAGDELDAALLQRITGSDAETRLGRAAAVGLVTHTVEGWRFSHPLVRRVLYDDLDPARRRAIHATVGTALRELAACGHRVGAAELAFHLIHSGISDVDEGAVVLLSDAGHQAYGLGAWSDAVLFFESGLTTGRCAGVDERVLAWLSYWAGLAHDRNYDIARATAHYHAAISWAREHREVELWGCCVLAEATMSNRRHAFTPPVVDAATVDLDEVLEQLGEDQAALRSRLLARYSAIDMSRARSADGLRRGEDAIRLARTSGDVLALENAFSSLGMASMSIGRATEACTSLREAQRHSNALRRPDLAGFATARLALSELMLGNLEEAAGASRAAGEAFGSVRHRSGECLVEAIEAALAVLRGDFKAAEAHGTASEARFRLSEYWFAPVVLYPALADARSMQGDDGGASDAIDAWKRSGQGGRGPVRLLVAARATRTAEAASILRDAERLMWFAAYPSMFATGFTGALAEGILTLGRTDLAPRLLEGLQRRLDESVVLSPGLSHNGRRTAGLLLWSLGDVDEARSELEAAVEMSTTSRALPELVRAQTDLGRLLAASPSTDDRANAAPHLVAAASLATRLGMVRARSAAELALASATRATRADVVEGRESTVVMFTDIVGSTSISVNAGDVMYVRVVEEHHALVRRELGRTRGREVHTTGDGMLARFGSADDALRCAVRIQALLRRRSAMRPDPTLEVRIGLALGKPIERDGTLYGAVVNLAARLCAAADAGEILVDETCQRAVSDPALFAPRGAIALKGFRSPVITYAVTSIADRLRTMQA